MAVASALDRGNRSEERDAHCLWIDLFTAIDGISDLDSKVRASRFLHWGEIIESVEPAASDDADVHCVFFNTDCMRMYSTNLPFSVELSDIVSIFLC